MPSPATLAGILAYVPFTGPNPPETLDDYAAALREAWVYHLQASIWTAIAISVVLAGLCFYRQRKFVLGWTWVWTVFVLLLGLPAFAAYLAHRWWPGRLPCPNCGRLAPRDRPACFACGREFPAPAPKGIEVFG